MNKRFRNLNFSLLPTLGSASIFVRLDHNVDEQLKALDHLQEFYERARAALMFFFGTDEKNETWRNDAWLRAGLNELYAMEDAARRGFRASAKTIAAPSLADSRNPLIHLMYVLRHVNVHTKPTPTKIEQVTVIYQSTASPQEMSYGSVMLDDMTTTDLLRSKEIRTYYQLEDLERSITWLMKNQRVFGVAEVFRVGVNAYCREVLAVFI